ncbi:RRQRL motif-containing zinc-binding protein [Streptomyces sp. NPDC058595]|uniref:RRQRL motif-containing zinc-binding protein n=1 Tax=Streptomyces sp. NPDC058595 TaxID=3346550 RepID=UPI0036595A4A
MPRTRKRRRREVVVRVLRGAGGLPEYDRGTVPEGLATRRQLRDRNLSPGGHGPVAILRCKACSYTPQWSCTHPTRAFLRSVDLAKPKRVPTLAQEWALDRAMAARQTCPGPCGRRYEFCLPLRSIGSCLECHDGTPADPTTYTTSPAPAVHRLAA